MSSDGNRTHSGKVIPLFEPEIRGNEYKYVKECLDTNWVSSVGSYVDRLEHDIASYVGSKHAVATASGTAALHTALIVAGIEPEDEVLVSTLSFIAPANAVRYIGAWPVFIDAEPGYWQMDSQMVVEFLEKECTWKNGELKNNTTGRRVKAVIPVHILGYPVDMDPIIEVAKKFSLVVIEDAAEALGVKYSGEMVGSLGDISCLSFNGNKIITTGGGGMILTNDEQWAQRARLLTTQAKDDPIEYTHSEVGYNYRLSNILAAVGCAQLENIDDYISIKRRIAEKYTEAFSNVPGIYPMEERDDVFCTYWMYTVLVDGAETGIGSRSLMKVLEGNNIQTRPLWQPLHLSRAHGQGKTGCAVAEMIYEKALSLPCSVGLAEKNQQRVIETVLDAIAK